MPDYKAELNVAGTWTDISDDVRTSADIVITRGRQDWSNDPDATKVTLTLNDRDGRYNPRNPTGPYYRRIGRNTKLRLSIPSPASRLQINDPTGLASTPAADAFDINGDLDVRIEFDADIVTNPATNRVLVERWSTTAADRSWGLRAGDGWFYFYVNGTNDHAGYAFVATSLYGGKALRVTMDVSDSSVTFYQAWSMDGPWTALRAATSFGFDEFEFVTGTTTPLTIGRTGASPVDASITRMQLRRGIGGPVAVDVDFTGLPAGTTAFTDSTGLPWTISGGAEVTDWATRFSGEIAEWPRSRDVSDRDQIVSITAQSMRRRLGTGHKALTSVLAQRIPTYGPVAYWACEDDAGSTQAYSSLDGVDPASVINMDFGAATDLLGSGALPTVDTSGGALSSYLTAPVPAYTSTGSWAVYWIFKYDSVPSAVATVMSVRTNGTVHDWRIQMGPAGTRIYGMDDTGDGLVDLTISVDTAAMAGQWTVGWFYVTDNGDGSLTWAINYAPVGGDTAGYSTTLASATPGTVTAAGSPSSGWSALVDGLAIGHISVWNTTETDAYSADVDRPYGGNPMLGYAGEILMERLYRLAAQENIPVRVLGRLDAGKQLGPQPLANFLDILDDAGDADGGVLLDQRDRPGMLYLQPDWLENQDVTLALSYTGRGHVVGTFDPTDDDSLIVNDATVSRSGGSSGRYVQTSGPLNVNPPEDDPDGVGLYDTQVTLNLYTDDQTAQIAGWLVYQGTWDEPRFPTLTINAGLIADEHPEVYDLDVGLLASLTDVPADVSPNDLLLMCQGYTETITTDRANWTLQLNCTPGGIWQTAVAATSRTGGDGSTLAAAVDETDTVLSVATDNSLYALWITTDGFPDDFPFDINVGGERMTVTGITGTASPQTFTVVRSVNGVTKPQDEGTPVTLWQPSYTGLAP